MTEKKSKTSIGQSSKQEAFAQIEINAEGLLTYANDNAMHLLKLEESDLLNKLDKKLIFYDESLVHQPLENTSIFNVLANKKIIIDNYSLKIENNYQKFSITTIPSIDGAGKLLGATIIFVKVDADDPNASGNMDSSNAVMKLEQLLENKNALIREVHHRVKNNMQLLSSIMALKVYMIKDEEAKIIFEEINTRVKIMSAIYARVHKSYDLDEIEVNQFLTQVIKDFSNLLDAKTVIFKSDILFEKMPVERALILGFTVSEMISNAVKHGFSDLEEGEVNTVLKKLESGKTCLAVTNSGTKIPEDSISSKSGIGLSMIKTFTRQLRGELSLDPENGFKIEF